MINANPLYHTLGGWGADGVTTMVSCGTVGATVSCWVVTVTSPFCSVFSIHIVQI